MKFLIFLLLLTPQISKAATDISSLQASLDTVWIAVAAAMVFFMQAGFALLESGMCRAKNTVNVIMKNYLDLCIGTIAFWLVGYGLMFGNNPTGWFGIDHFAIGSLGDINAVGLLFQTMFAATAVTIASGAMAERTSYSGYLFGAIGTTAIIYPVFGSWAWTGQFDGAGWLVSLGFIDFAGSTVVHSVGGWVALAGIMVLGPRLGRYGKKNGQLFAIPGHNLTLVGLGGFILWFGWMGFNGGSTLEANTSIGLILINTHLAAASGTIAALLTMVALKRPILMTTTINGSLAGLVSVTAGCATMEPMFAAITGFIAGVILIFSMSFFDRLKLDDVVGAVSVHGVCGAWGTLAAGMFQTGQLLNIEQIGVQLIGIGAAFFWAFPMAYLMYTIINKTIGLKVSLIDEQRGLDFSEHYELGYPEFQKNITHDSIR